MKREVTQFSMVEFNAFVAAKREPTSEREKYMKLLAECLAAGATPEVNAAGGIDNIQRVRVLEDGPALKGEFVFMPKLPPALVAERKRQAEREALKKAFLTEMGIRRNDPKARQAIIDAAIEMLGRGLVLGLLKSLSKSKPTKKPVHKAAPKKKLDPYEAALRQDRRNRIEASKEAAKKFHEEHGKKVAS